MAFFLDTSFAKLEMFEHWVSRWEIFLFSGKLGKKTLGINVGQKISQSAKKNRKENLKLNTLFSIDVQKS